MRKSMSVLIFLTVVTMAFNTQDKLTKGRVKPSNDYLMFSYGNDPDTLNPITSNNTTSGGFMRWVVDTMAERKIDDPDQFENVLAEKWEFDEKNLEFTIHLRKGVMWHPTKFPDGTVIPAKEFTADDVKFTFDCILNKFVNAAHTRSYYEDPDAKDESEKIKIIVTQLDKYTMKVKWRKPYFLAPEFTLGISLIPKHVYSVDEKGEPISLDFSSEEFAKGFNDHWHNSSLCGTGPMMFSFWKKNERLELVRNPNYWAEPFFFSKMVFKNIPNSNTSLQLFLNGDLDWEGIGEKNLYMQTKEDERVKSGKVKLIEWDATVYRYIGYNQKREIFKDVRVRRALSHAVPVQRIIDNILYGLGKRLSGPFIPGSSSYDEALQPIPFDPEKAKAILEEAGWRDTNSNGIRDKMIGNKLFELRFDLMAYADSQMYTTICELIKEEFRKIGVDLKISQLKWALMLDKLRKKEFDACMLGWSLGWKQDPYQIFHGSQADIDDSSNHVAYKNAELDKLIVTLRETFDEKKQRELYHKIHKIIFDDQPYTFLFVDKATGGYLSRIQNMKLYKVRPYTDAREWSVIPENFRK